MTQWGFGSKREKREWTRAWNDITKSEWKAGATTDLSFWIPISLINDPCDRTKFFYYSFKYSLEFAVFSQKSTLPLHYWDIVIKSIIPCQQSHFLNVRQQKYSAIISVVRVQRHHFYRCYRSPLLRDSFPSCPDINSSWFGAIQNVKNISNSKKETLQRLFPHIYNTMSRFTKTDRNDIDFNLNYTCCRTAKVLSGSSLRFAVFEPGRVEQLAGEANVLPRDTPGVHAEFTTGLRYVRRALQRREARLQAESVRRCAS